ncbi:MAG: recombinase family protein [Blautia sp.]|nr:recombinase family protein [Blautia sp.]
MVWNILKQEMYYGAVVGHKREYVIPCHRTSRAIPRKGHIIVEVQHDPIITKEE